MFKGNSLLGSLLLILVIFLCLPASADIENTQISEINVSDKILSLAQNEEEEEEEEEEQDDMDADDDNAVVIQDDATVNEIDPYETDAERRLHQREAAEEHRNIERDRNEGVGNVPHPEHHEGERHIAPMRGGRR